MFALEVSQNSFRSPGSGPAVAYDAAIRVFWRDRRLARKPEIWNHEHE